MMLVAGTRFGPYEIRGTASGTKSHRISLQLRYGTTLAIVDASVACLIGRDDDCRMRVDHRLVSRRHASIECVSGRFFLQDHSTNGSEICQLKGAGAISLGIEPRVNRGPH